MVAILDTNETLHDATHKVKEFDAAVERRHVDGRTLKIQDGHLVCEDQSYALTDPGFGVLSSAVAAPHRYLEKLGPALRSYLLNRHLANGELRSMEIPSRRRNGQVIVFARDGEFIGLARPDLISVRAGDMLESVLDGIRDELGPKTDNFSAHKLSFRGESFQLDIVSPDLCAQVRPTDVLNAGLRVSHSFIAAHPTTVETYILRQVCSNGMTRRECAAKRSARIRRDSIDRPDGVDRQLKAIRLLTRRVAAGLNRKLDAILKLRDQPVEDSRRFIQGQLREVPRLHSQRLLNRIMKAWEEEGAEPTVYGITNAMTRLATHGRDRDVRERQRRALGALAGVIATRSQHVCPACYRMIPAQ